MQNIFDSLKMLKLSKHRSNKSQSRFKRIIVYLKQMKKGNIIILIAFSTQHFIKLYKMTNSCKIILFS